jgi:hypothetical protein
MKFVKKLKELFKNKNLIKMKNRILIFALCLSSFSLFAQQQETLFGKSRVVGGFGGPIVEYNFGNDDVEVSVGGGGAIIIGDFFLGGYGMGTTNNSWINDTEPFQIDLGHGGFWIGGTYPSHKLIHFFSSVKIGWGAVNIRFINDDIYIGDNVFVLEPEAGFEVNIFRWFRIAATGHYRWVDGIDPAISRVSSNYYNGFGANLTFRFGGFGNNWKSWDD